MLQPTSIFAAFFALTGLLQITLSESSLKVNKELGGGDVNRATADTSNAPQRKLMPVSGVHLVLTLLPLLLSSILISSVLVTSGLQRREEKVRGQRWWQWKARSRFINQCAVAANSSKRRRH